MGGEESDVKDIDYDDPKYRITPFQQAAASCTGALLTSLLGSFYVFSHYELFKKKYL